MPGTEVVSKQAIYGGAAGIALLAFALIYRFYPGHPAVPAAPAPPAESATVPSMSLTSSAKTAGKTGAKSPQATTEPAAPVAPAAPPTKAIAALLKKAAKAFDDGHLTSPKDASALAFYQQVLAADKDNAAARSGLEKIHKSLLQQAGDALDRGDERDSARLIGELAQVPATEEDVSDLQSRLKTLRQVMPLLTRAADLLQQGHATTPSGGNALAVYRQVLKLDPGNKLAALGLVQVQQGFLDLALAAAAQDDFNGADKILADASTVSPGSQELLDTRSRIEGIRRDRAANTLTQANSALDAGNADLAETLAKKALALSPDLSGIDAFNERLRNARLYASYSPGQVITDKFRDRHGSAPPLVVIPTGSFMMGAAADDRDARANEEPQRMVKIDSGFALGRDDVSVGEFRVFIEDSDYVTDAEKAGVASVYDESTGRMIERRGVTWRDDYLGSSAADDLPVINVSWNDAVAYTQWLSARTGKHYRLPSEAEYEYALRAGSSTRYPWGDGNPPREIENITGDGDRSPKLKRSWAKAFRRYEDGYWGPAPIGKFPPNAFGLVDIDGNVSVWVADCWHDNYMRAPADSSAWMNPGCAEHVIRGGSWGSAPDQVRSAYRLSAPSATRSARVGIRVARDL
ncbi:MAG: formylglycine-generating enzyme family protein [Xanthomonadales bacterium PRO7]|nr:formylglycine-generating enzyme family protein [Xanthomonadales bacterium PRO7]